MSTRSFIMRVIDDETVEGIYCHYDGYPMGVGKVLYQNYAAVKTKGLMTLGNISVLEPSLYPITPHHTFDTPEEGVTIAYSRDRGEKDQEARVLPRDLILEECPFDGIEWYYLLDENENWLVRKFDWSEWKPLKDLLLKIILEQNRDYV